VEEEMIDIGKITERKNSLKSMEEVESMTEMT
jgi:hypothetical protein